MSKKIAFILVAMLVFVSLFIWVKKTGPTKQINNPPTQPKVDDRQQDQAPKIISTKPDPLEEAIVSAAEVIEITFNRPLENVGEFKVRIDPKIDFKVELTQDRKTAKIIPAKAYELGAGYTLFIGPETKFDGVGRWGEEKIFHFRTIKYRGI